MIKALFVFSLIVILLEKIEEMGVDRHMEEILRKAEQNIMSDQAFVDFLISRGFDKSQIAQMEKGEKDITILTGPHLGGGQNLKCVMIVVACQNDLFDLIATLHPACCLARGLNRR